MLVVAKYVTALIIFFINICWCLMCKFVVMASSEDRFVSFSLNSRTFVLRIYVQINFIDWLIVMPYVSSCYSVPTVVLFHVWSRKVTESRRKHLEHKLETSWKMAQMMCWHLGKFSRRLRRRSGRLRQRHQRNQSRGPSVLPRAVKVAHWKS